MIEKKLRLLKYINTAGKNRLGIRAYEPDPKNPTGRPNQIKYKKKKDLPEGTKVIEGRKGKKRTPSKEELELLKKTKNTEYLHGYGNKNYT